MARCAVVLAWFVTPGAAAEADVLSSRVPLPPRRSDVLPGPPVQPRRPAPAPDQPPIPSSVPSTPPAPATSAAAPITPEDVAVCDGLLSGGTVKAERLPPVDDGGGCAIAAPVRLSAVLLADGKTVTLEPPAELRCTMAAAIADWIRQDLAPVSAKRDGGLAALLGTGGYQCRGRNRVAGAKLSEHASGNAVDIMAFRSADGHTAAIAQSGRDTAFFAQVKLTTCARFATVLGPGSDSYHGDNLHLDLAARRHATKLCRWQLL